MSATPRPWTYDKRGERLLGENGKSVVVWKSGIAFGLRNEETEANSKFIVRAVNSYDALREALEAVLAVLYDEGPNLYAKQIEQAEAALKLDKEGQ